jgi:sRNA-binding protein
MADTAATVSEATDTDATAAASAALSVRAVGQLLATHFPALFAGPARPLKLRIQADIQQRVPGVFTREQLSAFLRRHTGQTAYLSAMARGGQRIDLDGAPAGEIAAEHREAAATEVQRRRANQQARFEQEREALRQQREAVRQEREALRREQDALHREQEQAMRRRASLLHDYENTRLSAANFCALKGIDPAQLDTLLAQARQEASQRAAAARAERGPGDGRPRPDRPDRPERGDRRPERDGPRPDRSGPRPDRAGPRGDRSGPGAERAGPRPDGGRGPGRREGGPPRRNDRPPGTGPRPPRKPSDENR